MSCVGHEGERISTHMDNSCMDRISYNIVLFYRNKKVCIQPRSHSSLRQPTLFQQQHASHTLPLRKPIPCTPSQKKLQTLPVKRSQSNKVKGDGAKTSKVGFPEDSFQDLGHVYDSTLTASQGARSSCPNLTPDEVDTEEYEMMLATGINPAYQHTLVASHKPGQENLAGIYEQLP